MNGRNPFGTTRVHAVSSGLTSHATGSSMAHKCPSQPSHIDDYYPHWPLFNPSPLAPCPAPYSLASQVLPLSDSSGSIKLASSGDMAMTPIS